MTFEQARNAIISALESYIGCPVNLSEQIENIPNFPYCYYYNCLCVCVCVCVCVCMCTLVHK